jgi:hypothetical protein
MGRLRPVNPKRKLICAVVALLVVSTACASTSEDPHLLQPEEVAGNERFLRQDVDCSVFRYYRGKWDPAAVFTLHPGGASSLGAGRVRWRGQLKRSGQASFFAIRIRDRDRPNARVLTHRYVIRDDEPQSNSSDPYGFTGRIDVFLDGGLGLRYFCDTW